MPLKNEQPNPKNEQPNASVNEKLVADSASDATVFSNNRPNRRQFMIGSALASLWLMKSAISPQKVVTQDVGAEARSYETHLPLVQNEQLTPTESFFQSLSKYFPELEEAKLSIVAPEKPEVLGALRAWQQLYDRYYQTYQLVIDRAEQLDWPTYYHRTLNEFYLDLTLPYDGAMTATERDEDGNPTRTHVYAYAYSPRAWGAEFVHPQQDALSLSRGMNVVSKEGISTLQDYLFMKDWILHNEKSIAEANPDQAITQPIEFSSELLLDPDVLRFTDSLKSEWLEAERYIKLSQGYRSLYRSIEQFGDFPYYPPGIQLLQRYIGKDKGRAEYQSTVESFASLFALLALEEIDSAEEGLMIAHLSLQGQKIDLDELSPGLQQAVDNWRRAGLLHNEQEWEALQRRYLTPNVGDRAIHPMVDMRRLNPDATNDMLINVYQIYTEAGADYAGYEEINDADRPTVSLLVPVEKNGETKWYTKELELKPDSNEDRKKFLYYVHIPDSVWVKDDGISIPRKINLQDKHFVIRLEIDELLRIPVNFKADFEEEGNYYYNASSLPAEKTSMPEDLIAQETSPPTAGVNMDSQSLTMPSQETQQALDELSDAFANSDDNPSLPTDESYVHQIAGDVVLAEETDPPSSGITMDSVIVAAADVPESTRKYLDEMSVRLANYEERKPDLKTVAEFNPRKDQLVVEAEEPNTGITMSSERVDIEELPESTRARLEEMSKRLAEYEEQIPGKED